MIKILVLDDTPIKLQKITSTLIQLDEISMEDIEVATDIITAKRYLRENKYDLLLLDIQIPNRIDQKAKVDGGIIFLKEIKDTNRYSIPNHIIGITAYDDSFFEANPEFDNHLHSLVKYSDSSDDWEQKILNSVKHIISTKKKGNMPSRARKYKKPFN
jgi:CheY-like chemotaxis protein